MEPHDLPHNPVHERQVFENNLDNAETLRWADCPERLRKEVSPLARFIVDPQLQQDLTAVPAEQLDLTDTSPAVSEQEIMDYKMEAVSIAAQNERSEIGKNNKNAYHDAEHARQVIDRTEQLIKTSRVRVTRDRARSLFIAAAYHDAEHPGVARRPHPQNFSVEQHSAGLADAYAREHGLSLRQRVEANADIISTTFWDGKIKPFTQSEQILHLADLGGYMESLPEWLEQSLSVSTENAKAATKSDYVKAWLDEPDFDKAVRQWIAGQGAFIKYALRPPHDHYQKQNITPGESWSAEGALQEKENYIKELSTNQSNPKLAEDVTKIRQTLQQLRDKYGKQ